MYLPIKHSFDGLFALTLLLILLPLMLVLVVLLTLQNQGSPWFTQIRPGKDGHFFTLYKFKSMRDTRDANGTLLPDHERMTPLGKIIRKLSLDELPQLWNVLKGEMSFVGPRPLLPEYLPLYNKNQWRRHHVRPGITGWAQINGRNGLKWSDKFKLDVYYVEQQSFVLDLKIIFFTLVKLVKPQGVNAGEQVTMEKFKGN